MASFLDIIQSAVVAVVIILLVLGIHLMTIKSGTENRVIQQMQGVADATVTILQEEIRFLHSFASDSVRVHHNTLYFRNTDGEFVYIETGNDSLIIIKTRPLTELANGTVSGVPSSNSIVLSGSPTVAANSVVQVSSTEIGEAQTKIIDSYNSSTKRLEIRGEWDMTPKINNEYRIFSTAYHNEQVYQLSLLNQSPNITTFNLRQLNADGSHVIITNPLIDSSSIDLISVSIVIRSRDEDLFQDDNQEFTVNLQKDFFLRGYRLPSVGG